MCSIIGALLRHSTPAQAEESNHILDHIWRASHARGRDGRGYVVHYSTDPLTYMDKSVTRAARGVDADIVPQLNEQGYNGARLVGNLRAEPTTEYVEHKLESDQQPYTCNGWSIAHNGTIANDRELRTHVLSTKIDSAAIAETLGQRDYLFSNFLHSMRELRGSFAILAVHAQAVGAMYVAANYRPVWYIDTDRGYFFASSRDFFPPGYVPQMVPPYTVGYFTVDGVPLFIDLRGHREPQVRPKALIVCSGGLDSVVSAAWAHANGYELTLVHFNYGSRAEGPENVAINEVSKFYGCEVIWQAVNLYRPGDSPLLDKDSKIAGGEAGAEFAYEWVPARNTMMLAMATALAEARGIEVIVLGNNLEEAGAYPDNEPEFIARFNDLLPFAVGDGKRMQIVMPVGNMMKHEIVALGHKLGAPMHLTWSCYRAGALHCGTCGPCFMRRTAFAINRLPEVIEYEN